MNLVELNHADRELMRALLGKLEQSIASMQAVAAGLRGALQPRPAPIGALVTESVAGSPTPNPRAPRLMTAHSTKMDPQLLKPMPFIVPAGQAGDSPVAVRRKDHTPESMSRDAQMVQGWLARLGRAKDVAAAMGVSQAEISKAKHGKGMSAQLEAKFLALLKRKGLR